MRWILKGWREVTLADKLKVSPLFCPALYLQDLDHTRAENLICSTVHIVCGAKESTLRVQLGGAYYQCRIIL